MFKNMINALVPSTRLALALNYAVIEPIKQKIKFLLMLDIVVNQCCLK